LLEVGCVEEGCVHHLWEPREPANIFLLAPLIGRSRKKSLALKIEKMSEGLIDPNFDEGNLDHHYDPLLVSCVLQI